MIIAGADEPGRAPGEPPQPPATHLAARTPVEHKVTAAGLGAGGGLTVAEFIDWTLGEYAFHGDVPAPVARFVLLVVTVLGAITAGYLAPHTTRPPEA